MANPTSASTELVSQWLERCVIDLSLCPFARAPYRAAKVRIVECKSESATEYLELIDNELNWLIKERAAVIETTLVVAERALPDFLDFNDFLAEAEALLEQNNRAQFAQIASFHPRYQFAGVSVNDAGNYTNRAPYPVVQWLRAESVADAVASCDTTVIPDNNIRKLQSMDSGLRRKLFPWVDG